MIRPRAFVAIVLLITACALTIRCDDLGNRPMHGDEAVHAEKFRDLWLSHEYIYDSNEYHGPTIYYAALPSVILHGRRSWEDTREADYRLPIALFGAAMIPMLLPMADGLGRVAVIAAAVLLAASPAFVFYSRYFIQEVPFVFFTLAMIAFGWRYARSRSVAWLILSSVAAGLMIATKETSVLTLLACAIAALLTSAFTRRASATVATEAGAVSVPAHAINWRPLLSPLRIAAAAVTTLAVASLFISGFGTTWHAPVDYLRAFTPWFHRARGASLQNHPFSYYLGILTWFHRKGGGVYSELLIVILAASGFLFALIPFRGVSLKGSSGLTWFAGLRLVGSPALWRFIAFYTLTLTLIYSVIPYKTPWCVLSFLLGMCLLAGLAVSVILTALKEEAVKLAALAVLIAAGGQLWNQAYRDSFIADADPHNPYVYAATAIDILQFQARIDGLARYWPQHNQLVIKVFASSNYYWPIPWYLRRYPNVGYFPHAPQSKAEAAADVTVCASELDDEVTPLLSDSDLMNGINEIRNGVFYETWIRMDVWTTYLNGKNGGVVRKFVPPPPAN